MARSYNNIIESKKKRPELQLEKIYISIYNLQQAEVQEINNYFGFYMYLGVNSGEAFFTWG